MANPLEAKIDIAATPREVWAVVSDLKRMGEWSPECRQMHVLGGIVREGTTTFNINRKGFIVWPTRSKVVKFEPYKEIAFRILEHGAVWSYELEPNAGGTTVVERREIPTEASTLSRLVKTLFGGVKTLFGDSDDNDDSDVDRINGMNTTLARIKAEAERK
ncbi:polyketide cyclase [Rhodococcus sp. WMMA185]|uniref:SRPBCC family protein n=1 Tax=Rhodococcus sp. WMMA185 TaxID=679318 RepID=UPI000878FD72|nr:SRPBCC family protein [Rhodococcus sp. WMMA185]AOW93273.1 polyketide cyclase [Rhodococcus sp. WMMA185]